jgi:large subunit ribosomal protein L23
MSKEMTLKPRISEKAYGVSEALNTYVFQVPNDANKLTVAKAVAEQYQVTVESVNIMKVKGKLKRTFKKNGKASIGRRSDFKKAYVTLKEGDSIVIFASEEDDKSSNKSGGKK